MLRVLTLFHYLPSGGYQMIRSLLAIVAIAFAVAACDQAPQQANPAPPPAPLPMKYWMVFFDTNSATLNDKAASTVAEPAGIANSLASSAVPVPASPHP